MKGSTLIKTATRTLNAALLWGILFGVSFYVLLFLYTTLSSNWSMPIVLNPQHERVITFSRDFNDRNLRLLETEKKHSELKTEVYSVKLTRDLAEKQIANFHNHHKVESIILREEYANLVSFISNLSKNQQELQRIREISQSLANPDVEFKAGVITRIRFFQDLLNKWKMDNDYITNEYQLQNLRNRLVRLEDRIKNFSGNTSNEELAKYDYYLKAKVLIENSDREIKRIETQLPQIEKSLVTQKRSIEDMQNTALFLATTQNVGVIFVPYSSEDNFKVGQPIKNCALYFFWCNTVGKIKEKNDSEIIMPHPLLNKPIRGITYSLELDNISYAKNTFLFAKTPFIGI